MTLDDFFDDNDGNIRYDDKYGDNDDVNNNEDEDDNACSDALQFDADQD